MRLNYWVKIKNQKKSAQPIKTQYFKSYLHLKEISLNYWMKIKIKRNLHNQSEHNI